MDTSKEYIEMCKNAQEIQDIIIEEGVFKGADFYANIKWDKSYKINIADEGGYNDVLDSYIWLPRQDQLQEMIEWKQQGIQERILYFSNETSSGFEAMNYMFDSFEKIWLAFVMKEKYNKIWKDGTWQNV